MKRKGFFPLLILATVTLTTIEVDGVLVIVTSLIEVAGVEVTKRVDVSSLGVKNVVVVWERVLLIVVAFTVNADTLQAIKDQNRMKLFKITNTKFFIETITTRVEIQNQ
jgi:hypothetical protein